LVAAACTGPEQGDAEPDPNLLPGGYAVRLDGDRIDPGVFTTAETADGIEVTTGPAGIAWRAQDTLSAGDFRVEAALILRNAPVGYREAYGVFVGGRRLAGPDLTYLYLMVRASGDFMVTRRTGSEVENLVDWLSHNAVQRVAIDGDTPLNTLAVEVRGEETRFLINGTVVFIMPTEEANPYGTAGLRVNHRLDLVLGRWSVGPPPPDSVTAVP
jgi:hypothetical protein